MSTLGHAVNSKQLRKILEHVFSRNNTLQSTGQRGTPILIWGTHGLGKTQSVMDYARQNNWKIAYCAPAQFEEMGDLHGLPTLMDPDKTISGDEYTIYSPPEWVPKEEGPGILLLDDINRADDRMLRGVMQLLQNFEMLSWKLPPQWQIVATANPDNGDYSVTPMDDAMLTRMMHITLNFDAKIWAEWAQATGLDPRGIDFVLTYPEAVTGKRTTPRSLAQFFDQISHIEDLAADIDLVLVLAKSTLDDNTVSSFMGFIQDDLARLIDPVDILNASDFSTVKSTIEAVAVGKKGEKRLDRISTICTRLYLHLKQPEYKPESTHTSNLVSFFLLDTIPNDLKMSLYMDVNKECSAEVKAMLKEKRLAKLLIGSL
jgi:MoxR-like ATPase